MPSPNRTHKVKYRNRKTQKGGKRLYSTVEEYTPEEIERIFCGGKLLSELRKPAAVGKTDQERRPIFFLKWAPMASGKSSEKVMRLIRSGLEPSKLEDCADVSSDKLVENLLPFRFVTTSAKMKNIRMKADIQLRNYSHAKRILQPFQRNLPAEDPLRKTVDQVIAAKGWPLKNDETQGFLDSLLQKQIRNTYDYYYRQEKNEEEKTLRQKVVEFFPRAYEQRVNLQYETAGLGYGEIDSRNIDDAIVSQTVGKLYTRTSLKSLYKQMASVILKNNFADFLGEVQYARQTFTETEETKEGEEGLLPIGVRPGLRAELFIPTDYRIIVIFPIVPIEELQRRGYLRAYQHLEHATLYDITVEQKDEIANYMKNLISTLISGSSKKLAEIESKITEILTAEFQKYTQITEPVEYVEELRIIQEKAKNPALSKITFPFFRLASIDLEKSIAQAFQYSVDYFLRQYIQIGRIEQVIYVNNN